MKIPTPSFFKIRLVALLVGFAVLCFIVGLVKDALADYVLPERAECAVLVRWFVQQTCSSSQGCTVNSELHFSDSGWSSSGPVTVSPGQPIYNMSYEFFIKFPGSGWSYTRNAGTGIFSNNTPFKGTTQWKIKDYPASGDCPVNCTSQENELTEQCGGSEGVKWHWTNVEACEGECLICRGAGEETEIEAQDRCAGMARVLTHYSQEDCRGICGCNENDYQNAKDKCYPYKLKYFSEILCDGECETCVDQREEAEAQCGPDEEVAGWDCDIDGGLSVRCKAKVVIPPNNGKKTDPDPPESNPDTTSTPAPDKNNDESDPQLTDIEKELEAARENLEKLIEQGNLSKDQRDKANSYLKWIGDNMGRTTDNTKNIADMLGQMKKDGLLDDESKDDLSGIEENTGDIVKNTNDISDTLEGIDEGDYTAPAEEVPYETEEIDFSERTSSFLAAMRTTGVFSLPNKISSSIPSGGSPILSINTGSTFGGTHTIDFSSMSSGLTVLKYIFQIAGMALAIRIVTLKR